MADMPIDAAAEERRTTPPGRARRTAHSRTKSIVTAPAMSRSLRRIEAERRDIGRVSGPSIRDAVVGADKDDPRCSRRVYSTRSSRSAAERVGLPGVFPDSGPIAARIDSRWSSHAGVPKTVLQLLGLPAL